MMYIPRLSAIAFAFIDVAAQDQGGRDDICPASDEESSFLQLLTKTTSSGSPDLENWVDGLLNWRHQANSAKPMVLPAAAPSVSKCNCTGNHLLQLAFELTSSCGFSFEFSHVVFAKCEIPSGVIVNKNIHEMLKKRFPMDAPLNTKAVQTLVDAFTDPPPCVCPAAEPEPTHDFQSHAFLKKIETVLQSSFYLQGFASSAKQFQKAISNSEIPEFKRLVGKLSTFSDLIIALFYILDTCEIEFYTPCQYVFGAVKFDRKAAVKFGTAFIKALASI